MKNFILCDEYSDYKNACTYKELKQTLIEELERDTFENFEEDIAKNNFKVLKRLVLEDYTDINYIKEQLLSFGWYVQDLHKLQDDLMNFQAYKHGAGAPSMPNDCIEQTLKMIESEMK